MDGNILYFKLVTGEHIIAFVDSADDEYVQLHKPLQLFLQNGMMGNDVPFDLNGLHYEDSLSVLTGLEYPNFSHIFE